jgi:diguanylate cyclase (GGDEF)-like protein
MTARTFADAKECWKELHAWPAQAHKRASELIRTNDLSERAWAQLVLAAHEQRFGDAARARLALNLALDAAKASGDARVQWLAQVLETALQLREGSTTKALESALALDAQGAPNAQDVFAGLHVQHLAHLRLGAPDAALRCAHSALGCAMQFHNAGEQAVARLSLSSCFIEIEDWQQSLRELDEAQLLADQIDNPWLTQRIQVNRALTLRHLGEPAAALAATRLALTSANLDSASQAALHVNAAMLLMDQSEAGSAADYLEKIRSRANSSSTPAILASFLHAEGRLLATRGQHSDALTALSRARLQAQRSLETSGAALSRILRDMASSQAAIGDFQNAYATMAHANEASEAFMAASRRAWQVAEQARFEVDRQRLERDQAQALHMQMDALALRDPLTGLHNRRHLDQTLPGLLNRCSRAQSPVSLALLDLDSFSHVNKQLGRALGDAALSLLAAKLQAEIRIYDMACRIGGDEFVLVFENCDAVQAQIRLNTIVDAVKAAWPHKPMLSISVGIAMSPNDSEDGQVLLQVATERSQQHRRTRMPSRSR